MTAKTEAVALLEAISATLASIDQRLARLERIATGPDVASDRELDSKHGNPEIQRDPKQWRGPSYARKRMSEAPPEYLDMLAEFKSWQAEQDSKKPGEDAQRYAEFARRDAARARGWAKRLRAGWRPPSATGPRPLASAAPEPEIDASDVRF